MSSVTVSFHNFKSRNFKLSVSNPKSKHVACLSVLSQNSNRQGLGRRDKFEILKADRRPAWPTRSLLRICICMYCICMCVYIYIYIYICVYIYLGLHGPRAPLPGRLRGLRRPILRRAGGVIVVVNVIQASLV